MGRIKWLKCEKIRRRARREIDVARANAPPTREGQRALAHRIEDIRRKMNRDIAQVREGRPLTW